MREFREKVQPDSLLECFILDEHEINPIPRGWFRKFGRLFISSRYSMPVLMRLTQYFSHKSQRASERVVQGAFGFLSCLARRMNEILNNFEHDSDPKIAAGILFHHCGVCITGSTKIESGVHIYRNVTFGEKDGGAPIIERNAKIGSHSIVLGNVVVGHEAIVAPGAVVVKDVPSKKVVAGVPARIIGDVNDINYFF